MLATDKLGHLSITVEGCLQRDRIVLEQCPKNRIPIAVNMGGIYFERIATIVEAQANTFREAQRIFF